MSAGHNRTEPAWLACLLRLSIDTHVDTFDFADWLHEHRFKLRDEFYQSGEPDYNAVEDTLGIWLRQRFLATITPGSAHASGPAGSFVDFAYEQARRKLL